MHRNETPQHASRRILIITRGVRRRGEAVSPKGRRAAALQIIHDHVLRYGVHGCGWKYASVAANDEGPTAPAGCAA